MVTQEEYEERVIVFIDILGFSEQIKKTVQNPEYFIKLRNVLNFIASLKKYNDAEEKTMGKEITVFSDSIVISYPAEQKGSVFFLILDVVHVQLDMMLNGILMRGGLTVGQLCHNDNIVYGPAMVEAYELETKAAIYPRVVVNEKVFDVALSYPNNSPEDDVSYISNMLHKDRDGQFYVDFLSQHQEADDEDSYVHALYNVKRLIETELSANPNPSVKMKYEWIKDRFNKVVEEILEKPEWIIE